MPEKHENSIAPDSRGAQISWTRWWPLAFGPAGMAFVYIADALDWSAVLYKPTLETLAIVLTMAASLTFFARALAWRNPLDTIMAALSIAFMCREFHWEWTGDGVYIAIALMGVWSWRWRERLGRVFNYSPPRRIWLYSTGAAYVLSQLIARRAFRAILPNEAVLHMPLEEVAETVAHLMLLVMAVSPPYGSVKKI